MCEDFQNSIEELKTEGIALHVVDEFIAPLWGVLDHRGGDPLPKLRAIRDELVGFSPQVLEAARNLARGGWSVWRSPAKCRELCNEAIKKLPNGGMIRIVPDTLPWNAWMRHYRETGEPFMASFAEREGKLLVPTEYPPVTKSQTAQSEAA